MRAVGDVQELAASDGEEILEMLTQLRQMKTTQRGDEPLSEAAAPIPNGYEEEFAEDMRFRVELLSEAEECLMQTLWRQLQRCVEVLEENEQLMEMPIQDMLLDSSKARSGV